jgi:hypothetical protein
MLWVPGDSGAAEPHPLVVEEGCEGEEGPRHQEGAAGRLPAPQGAGARAAQGGCQAGDV